MPVIFKTPTSHTVLMFDKDAALMLSAMKISGNIPGALFPEDITDALEALQDRIKLEKSNEEETNNDDNHVGVHTKAIPLIELMQRALKEDEKLLWNEG